MLPDLLEVYQWIFQSLANGGHTAKSSPLELLTLKERLTIFEQTNIVARNCLYERLCCGKLAKSDSEVVRIIQSVEQVAMEGMDVLKAREGLDGLRESFGKRFGRVLDLTSVESSDTADLEPGADLCAAIL